MGRGKVYSKSINIHNNVIYQVQIEDQRQKNKGNQKKEFP
jgi:hypothetical protein